MPLKAIRANQIKGGSGGGREIRTLGTIARTTVFEFDLGRDALLRLVRGVLASTPFQEVSWHLIRLCVARLCGVGLQSGLQ